MWKKNRVQPISQVDSDIQSPQRGDFFVGKVGFPTPVLDLFVKNRERFVRAKTKRIRVEVLDRFHSDASPPPAPHMGTLMESSSNSLGGDLCLVAAQLDRTENADFDGGVLGFEDDQNRVKELGTGWNPNLRTEEFNVGFTISASLLLLSQHFGRRVSWFRKPCSDAKVATEYLIQRVFDFVIPRKSIFSLKGTKSCHFSMQQPALTEEIHESEYEFVSSSTCSPSSLDIEVLESNADKKDVGVEKVSIGGNYMNFDDGNKALDSLELKESKEVIEECEHCVAQKRKLKLNARIKFNMKLVARKLRSSKRDRKNKEKEGSSSNREDGCSSTMSDNQSEISQKSQDQEKIENAEKVEENKSPLLDIGEYCSYVEESKNKDGMAYSIVPSMQAKKTVRVIGGKNRMSAGYLILFLILAGLLVGRVASLLIVLTWLGGLKFVERQRRSVKNTYL